MNKFSWRTTGAGFTQPLVEKFASQSRDRERDSACSLSIRQVLWFLHATISRDRFLPLFRHGVRRDIKRERERERERGRERERERLPSTWVVRLP